jgi:hypothetical protein
MRYTARFFLLVLIVFAVTPLFAQSNALTLELLGTYATGTFDEGGSEISAYHAGTQQLFIINGAANVVDVVSIADPSTPTLVSQIDLSEYGDGPTSVAVSGDLVAIAVDRGQENGNVVFADPTGAVLTAVEVGSLPDNVVFTPDGSRALTANEGEPNGDYSVDPEGSVSIIDLGAGVENATITTVGFTDFNEGGTRAAELPAEVRIYGPNATVAQDLEPEYIAVTPDGSTAYVVLQENNALAIIDIENASVVSIVALGFKDHSVEGNGIDASDEDGMINIQTWPVFGMYQPDGIAAYEVDGEVYIVSANEGDSRDYDAYAEEARVADLTLDPEVFGDVEALQAEAALGRLTVTTALGDDDGDGVYEALYVLGARSFSIWDAAGNLVWDSGDQFEQITAALYPEDFNSNHVENGSFDNRSDNKGPEPEGVTLTTINERVYAFIGFERLGGVIVYDVTDPTAPEYTTYINNRDFSGDAEAGTAGDLGPEGLLIISASDSPTGETLLVVASEVSGSTSVFRVSSN